MSSVGHVLSSLVRHRARYCCEYCRLSEVESDLPFTIDHIVARQHGGLTDETNLALACPCCNLHKGPNLSGIDPQDGTQRPLFHPRRQKWADHFRWDGVGLVGITPTGRVTIRVLAMNDDRQLAARRAMLSTGWLLRIDK